MRPEKQKPLIHKEERIVMKIGIVAILVVFGQFAFADDRCCEIQDYSARGMMLEMNEYVLEQCQDGDAVRVVYTGLSAASGTDFVGKHC